VVVAARIERNVRTLDEKTLSWGNEKECSRRQERIGATTQNFVIVVQSD
jgi:hypothetical protein